MIFSGFSIFSIFSSFFSIGGKFGMIRKLLKKSWKWIAIIAVLIALFFYREYLLGIIEDKNEKLDHYEEKIDSKNETIDKLNQAIDTRNQQIRFLSKKSQEKKQQFKQRTDELKQEREQAEQRVQQILNEKTPETCDQAIKYLHEGKEQLKWDENE